MILKMEKREEGNEEKKKGGMFKMVRSKKEVYIRRRFPEVEVK